LARKKSKWRERIIEVAALGSLYAFIQEFYTSQKGTIILHTIVTVAPMMGAIILIIVIDLILPSSKEIPKKRNVTKKDTKKRPVGTAVPKGGIREDKIILGLPLEQLNGYEFERLMELYFVANGYIVERTKKGSDKGVDLVVSDRNKERWAIQLKHFSTSSVGRPDVQKLVGAKREYGCTLAWFITTSRFSAPALEYADTNHVLMWDGTKVTRLLRQWKEKNKP